jgi:hypothetical protein
MSDSNTGAYRSRSYRRGDEAELVRLYNLVTGRSRTLEQHNWEWLENPAGRDSMWVIEDAESGEIIGHHGLIPMRLNFFDRSIPAGKTENTMVHPGHRGRVGYFAFEKTFHDLAREKFDLLFTNLSYGKPLRIRMKLGYEQTGFYANYVKISSKEKLERIAVGRVERTVRSRTVRDLLAWLMRLLAPLVQRLAFGKNIDPENELSLERVEEIEEVSGELDRLWERSKSQFGITIQRDAHFLKWRVFDNPHVDYDFLVARKNGKLIGYVAYEQVRKDTAWLLDLIVEGNDARLLEALVRAVVRRLSEDGIFIVWISTMRGKTTLSHALKRNGFRSISSVSQFWHKLFGREVPVLVVKVLDDDLDRSKALDPDCWYYTSIFEEGRPRGGTADPAPSR